MDRKHFRGEVKSVDKEIALVKFATFGVIDQDGDVTKQGYFGEQPAQAVGAHDWGAVPIGRARVFEQPDGGYAELRFNTATSGGRDWYEAIKFDFANPPSVQQYSYGFTIKAGGASFGEFGDDGREVRFLGPLSDGSPGCIVHEVSPVLMAAGTGTGTVDVKNRHDRPSGLTYAEAIGEAAGVLVRLRERTEAIADIRKGRGLSLISPERSGELKSLRDELGRFASMLAPLVMGAPSPEEAFRLRADFERQTFALSRLTSAPIES